MSHAFKFCILAIGAVLGMGDQALAQCFVCSDSNANTASGTYTLGLNTSGGYNTATGFVALGGNTSGSRNNASGGYALFSNTTADDNNAMGYVAMYSNTIGTLNNAVGSFSLFANTSGNNNNAVGYAALYRNSTGSNNNAQGFYALQNNTTGSNNIAIGQYSGNSLTTGSNNIDIGNYGVAGESGVIRIGAVAQTAAYVAGIHNSPITGAAVYVSSSGQLGVLASSERYKTAITSMGAATEKLQRLRPVTFHLKSEPDGALQYGLIAEEVAKVYPELVIRDATGRIQGVRYDELAPMLLNEVQQLQLKVQYQQQKLTEVEQLKQQVAELKQQNESMQAVLAKLLTKDQRVAMR
jgi:Chaperone of endosialidase